MLKKSDLISVSSDVLVLRGAKAILEQAPLLESLAARCGQPAAMHWLKYFITAPSFFEKEPYMVLLLESNAQCSREPGALRVEDLRAAVMMYEYHLLGVATHAFSTDDISGFRTVVAPAAQRAAAAEIAADAMLKLGAQFVLISYCAAAKRTTVPSLIHGGKLDWARRSRPVEKMLPLAESFEATLATLGKSTRFNLRYYRKRLLKKMPCEFVADARDLLRDAELESLNARSLNPVAPEQFVLQYRSACDLPGGFVVGLRDPQGNWLSLIGGWRQESVTVLYWQMNAAGYEKDSLGTVMRSFFLENEIEQGARQLIVYGGTTHSMGNSFVREEATDLMVRRRSWKAALLRVVAHGYCAADRFVGRPNFLARAIGCEELQWQPGARSDSATAANLQSVDHPRHAAAFSQQD